jgi:hypothetical protein
MGLHQVDKAKEGPCSGIRPAAGHLLQVAVEVGNRGGGVAFEVEQAGPEGGKPGVQRQLEEGVGAGKGVLHRIGEPPPKLGVGGQPAVQGGGQGGAFGGAGGQSATVVVKGFKAAPQAVFQDPHQRVVAKAHSGIAAQLQQLCQGGQGGAQLQICLDSLVGAGIFPRKEGSVGGDGPLGRGDGPLEEGGFGSQPIQVGAGGHLAGTLRFRPVAGETICPLGIQHDQQDVGAFCSSASPPPASLRAK